MHLGRTALVVAAMLIMTVWAAAVFAAPAVMGRRASMWSVRSAALTYVVGRFVCHQRLERSFVVAGAPMPVCGRCTGLYVAAPFGAALVLAPWRGRWSAERRRRFLLWAGAPTAATFLLEITGLWDPGNVWRAVAALPLGAAVAALAAGAIAGRLR